MNCLHRISAVLCLLPGLLLCQSAPLQSPGAISGAVFDRTQSVVVRARVTLSSGASPSTQETLSDNNGEFNFANVLPGPFRVTVNASGFATQIISGTVLPGQTTVIPQMTLNVATLTTDVNVTLSPVDIAEEQIKDQEKQRIIGLFPNFYITYLKNPLPLTTRQKFELAWKSSIDPVTFGVTAIIAGVQQKQNTFSGYGQGAQGYAKRYAASYTDFVSATFLGSAILPSLLKQDPRYFYKGTGTIRSRILYAIANSVITKGDNGRWQPGYSNIIGNLAASGISNLYYPAQDRHGAGLTFENAFIGIGADAAANLLQEFFFRKLTPSAPHNTAAKP